MQKSGALRHAGQEHPLKPLVNAPGQAWSGTRQVFKNDGWLDASVLVGWAIGYTEVSPIMFYN